MKSKSIRQNLDTIIAIAISVVILIVALIYWLSCGSNLSVYRQIVRAFQTWAIGNIIIAMFFFSMAGLNLLKIRSSLDEIRKLINGKP